MEAVGVERLDGGDEVAVDVEEREAVHLDAVGALAAAEVGLDDALARGEGGEDEDREGEEHDGDAREEGLERAVAHAGDADEDGGERGGAVALQAVDGGGEALHGANLLLDLAHDERDRDDGQENDDEREEDDDGRRGERERRVGDEEDAEGGEEEPREAEDLLVDAGEAEDEALHRERERDVEEQQHDDGLDEILGDAAQRRVDAIGDVGGEDGVGAGKEPVATLLGLGRGVEVLLGVGVERLEVVADDVALAEDAQSAVVEEVIVEGALADAVEVEERVGVEREPLAEVLLLVGAEQELAVGADALEVLGPVGVEGDPLVAQAEVGGVGEGGVLARDDGLGVVDFAADGVGRVAVAEREATVGVEEADGGVLDAGGGAFERDAVDVGVRAVADAPDAAAPVGGGVLAVDHRHEDGVVGLDAGAGLLRGADEGLVAGDAVEDGDGVGGVALGVCGLRREVLEGDAGDVARVAGAQVGEALLEVLWRVDAADREAQIVAERVAEARHLWRQTGEVAGLRDGHRVVVEGLAHGLHLEADDAHAGGDGRRGRALRGHAEREGLVERGESRLEERRPQSGTAVRSRRVRKSQSRKVPVRRFRDCRTVGLSDSRTVILARRDGVVPDAAERGERGLVDAGVDGVEAEEPVGVDDGEEPRLVGGGEVEVEVRDEQAVLEDTGDGDAGLGVGEGGVDLLEAAAVGAADALLDLAELGHVVGVVGLEVAVGRLVEEAVPGALLRLERLDLGVDLGDFLQQRLAALGRRRCVALGLALVGQGGAARVERAEGLPEAVDGGGEELLVGLRHGARVGIGGVEHAVAGGELQQVGDILLLGQQAFLAHGKVVGIERGVGERDGVVEVASALDAGVGRPEEHADDGALVRGLRHAAEDVREERGVGGAAVVGRVVGREAVGVERRGEQQHLLGAEVALPAVLAGEDHPEVLADGVDDARERVDGDILRAVGVEEPGGLRRGGVHVDARHERGGAREEVHGVPLREGAVADDDGGPGAVDEGLLGFGGLAAAHVEHRDGAREILALDGLQRAVADVHGRAGKGLGEAPRGDAVVEHQRAGDGRAAVGERAVVGLLDERGEGLRARLEPGGGQLLRKRREARFQVVGADEAVRMRGELRVQARVDGVAADGGGDGLRVREEGARGGEEKSDGGAGKEGHGMGFLQYEPCAGTRPSQVQ